MFGFLFAAACAIGLAVVIGRGSRWHRRGRRPLHYVLERLDATPAQEKAIVDVVEQLRARGRDLRSQFKESRSEFARLMEGDRFDELQFDDIWSRQESRFSEVRRDLTLAFAKIHELLDERQRKTLASLIEKGPGFAYHGRHHGFAHGARS